MAVSFSEQPTILAESNGPGRVDVPYIYFKRGCYRLFLWEGSFSLNHKENSLAYLLGFYMKDLHLTSANQYVSIYTYRSTKSYNVTFINCM